MSHIFEGSIYLIISSVHVFFTAPVMTTLFCYVDVQGTYNFKNITKYFKSSKTRFIRTLTAIPD